jgi:hypothetical protein
MQFAFGKIFFFFFFFFFFFILQDEDVLYFIPQNSILCYQ